VGFAEGRNVQSNFAALESNLIGFSQMAAEVVRRPVDLLAGSRLPFAIDRDPRA